ncbi:hypothetical protein [Oleomonas cavernae]|uniref:hypothetical protein n=1 Tax=Oleomonas cavernae TaxID=2320859 RepID=UPI0013143C8E|nr:hypothetical protein [Oleomonas cavernae]
MIADRLLDPAPITAQDVPAHAAVGEALADALAALSRVKARVDELEATVAGEGI